MESEQLEASTHLCIQLIYNIFGIPQGCPRHLPVELNGRYLIAPRQQLLYLSHKASTLSIFQLPIHIHYTHIKRANLSKRQWHPN